jgi:hypothetical protein
VREHRGPVFDNVFVEQDSSPGIAQQSRQRCLTVEEREIAEILDQIEGVEDGSTRGHRSAQVIEASQAVGP